MAQGGDPTGTGGGGPGYEFANEDSDLKFDKAGVVAMANAGRDTNGSQFFITFVPTPQLDGGYTIFGQVASGMDVVNGITRRDPEQNPDFTGDVIQSITITEE
jgi:cyclophilin family peptidyl-prolyl cis-trans isomerase